ncbi:PepSY domain-containing protein [Luteimonas granuli]|uniref:PepSY domain-containing protein n=1 Tax=Luteimonas granuli TaxID=1176533 RepID=A0A518N3N1_9GAMM|nr:PepSY domain-containing protein [Luteimonas granuli]QDW66508.1 PepSY domain-containing protein [Luteimonas granuli]
MRQHAGTLALGLSFALCVAGNAVAQAPPGTYDAMTSPQIRAALEAQGYTKINDLEFEDGVWKADARSADGQRVELRVDPATGKAWPEDAVAELSEADVRARLAAEGYTKVHDVEFEDGMWTAEAEDPGGRKVGLTLDPDTGRVVGKDR